MRFPGLLLHCPADINVPRIFNIPVEPAMRAWIRVALIWPGIDCERFWKEDVGPQAELAIIMSNGTPGGRWEVGLLVVQNGYLSRGTMRWVKRLCRVWYRMYTCNRELARLTEQTLDNPETIIMGEKLKDDTEWCVDGSTSIAPRHVARTIPEFAKSSPKFEQGTRPPR